MPHAEFRFHDRLNDFLPPASRGISLSHDVSRRAAIKDVIESLGVPHTEVDVILVDGASVGFEHMLGGGERVAVYPWTTAPRAARHLRPRPPACPRFLADAQLGRLARYLRLLGFDCQYDNDIGDAQPIGPDQAPLEKRFPRAASPDRGRPRGGFRCRTVDDR